MRTRTVLGAVAGLVVAAAVVAVAVPVVRHSDAFTTTIRTAPDAPVPPEQAPLPASVRELWAARTGAATAPVEGPSVIETGTNRVAGLDPTTGRERWSYERGNATLCDATRQDGVVLALFAKSHGCRDLVALDAATGQRRWYRTIEITTSARLTSSTGTAVVTGGGRMIAVDTGGGLNRWTYSTSGCTLDPAVVGPDAVATVSRCAGGLRRLVVHSPTVDKAPWVGSLPTGSDPHVLTTDRRVTVLAGSTLSTYSVGEDKNHKTVASPAGDVLDDRLAGSGTPAAVVDGDFLVVWTGETAAGVDLRTPAVRWRAPATGPPALTGDHQVLLAGPDGFTIRPPATGQPVTTVTAGTAVPDSAGLSRIGGLIVAAGAGRLVAYG
ncbi:MAG TPA: PQQ-binding-like beta-propeller repeat protein [Mycobacteriales bacterium]|nr:PQQ-binding-like beta-propeller repeat protein [Mycobacteriales bacterium]